MEVSSSPARSEIPNGQIRQIAQRFDFFPDPCHRARVKHLQFKFSQAAATSARFVYNTTFGLLGLIDDVSRRFRELEVQAVCADFTQPLEIPGANGVNNVGFYPGSTIGNPSTDQEGNPIWRMESTNSAGDGLAESAPATVTIQVDPVQIVVLGVERVDRMSYPGARAARADR